MNTRLAARRTQAGVTLVESAVVVSVAAIVTGLAVPNFGRAIDRRHLEGAAAQLETDIHYARSLAVVKLPRRFPKLACKRSRKPASGISHNSRACAGRVVHTRATAFPAGNSASGPSGVKRS